MNSYQVMGIIAFCTLLFSGVVAFLAMQGVHVLLALGAVYAMAVWSMFWMQRAASRNCDIREDLPRRHLDMQPREHRARAIDFKL